MQAEGWNEIFKKLLENRIVSDKIATLQSKKETDEPEFAIIDLSESDFPDLYKFIQDKRDLVLSISYTKTEVKNPRILYRLVERKKGKPSQPYYFPAFDYSKEPPAGLLNVLTSSQDRLLDQIEKQIIEFMGLALTELHLPPTNSYIRRFEHQLASKFGLQSSSEGEGRNRHVVIRKNP
ncbi:MAG TPA: R3H domain-containing nucleic acid-binding protein [Candidatus Limnocylindrales bacterium]|nr:R3H domain-containing nucleic acid-binding protein [Candidatus Limnocylindrales bacterium]